MRAKSPLREITMPAKIARNVNDEAAIVNVGGPEVVTGFSGWLHENPPGVGDYDDQPKTHRQAASRTRVDRQGA